MSRDSKRIDDDKGIEGVFLTLGIAVAVLFLFIATSGLALGFSLSRKSTKALKWAAPLTMLGLLFIFAGVPFLHAPQFSAESAYEDHIRGTAPYFLSVEDLKEEIATNRSDIESVEKDLEIERKDRSESIRDGIDYQVVLSTNLIDSYYENFKELKAERTKLWAKIRKANYRFRKPAEFHRLAVSKTGRYLERHHIAMTKGYVWFVLSFLLALFVGGKVRAREDGFLEKFARIGFLLSIPGRLVLFPFKSFIRDEIKEEEQRKEANRFRFGSGKEGYLSEKNLALHTQVIGGSGVGKTNFLKTYIADRVSKQRGLIFLDFKADFEVLKWLQLLCARYGRNDFKIFTLSDAENSVPYNPIEYGSATEITSQLMNSFNWSEEYYKNYSENVLLMSLNLLCFLRDRDGTRFHLGHLLKILSDSKYRYSLLSKSTDYKLMKDVGEVFLELDEKKGIEKTSGLVIQLKKILYSSAGDIFTSNVEKYEPLKFREALRNGEVVYLFMNSMSLKEVASSVGKMILQDLMKEVGNIYDSRVRLPKNVSIVIDEFASFATPDFINFLDKARGAGIELMLAHQSMSDLKEISDNFATRIFENTASKIIFNTQSADDAEKFASMLGTYGTKEDTKQIETGVFFGTSETGVGSRRNVEKYNIHPNTFKNLLQGEAVVICTKVDTHYGVTKIVRAPEYEGEAFLYNKSKNFGVYLSFGSLEETEPYLADSFMSDKKAAPSESDGIEGI